MSPQVQVQRMGHKHIENLRLDRGKASDTGVARDNSMDEEVSVV